MSRLLLSPSGVQDLAGNCMTIMAIGEGFRKIDIIWEILSMCNFVKIAKKMP